MSHVRRDDSHHQRKPSILSICLPISATLFLSVYRAVVLSSVKVTLTSSEGFPTSWQPMWRGPKRRVMYWPPRNLTPYQSPGFPRQWPRQEFHQGGCLITDMSTVNHLQKQVIVSTWICDTCVPSSAILSSFSVWETFGRTVMSMKTKW